VGAFRSQDPTRLNGKVASIDPVTLEWHIVSTGHRNGFRLTSHRGHVYATDTGWYTVEEVRLQRGACARAV
jgi:glucose/arabinose dehydrogenase